MTSKKAKNHASSPLRVHQNVLFRKLFVLLLSSTLLIFDSEGAWKTAYTNSETGYEIPACTGTVEHCLVSPDSDSRATSDKAAYKDGDTVEHSGSNSQTNKKEKKLMARGRGWKVWKSSKSVQPVESPEHSDNEEHLELSSHSTPTSSPTRGGTSSSQRSEKAETSTGANALVGKTFSVYFSEQIPWVPIDSLMGYERSQNYIVGDGNCLFRALAHLHYGYQDYWSDVKTEITNYMREHPNVFGPALIAEYPDEPNEDRVERRVTELLQKGAWGDDHESSAFANLKEMNLITVSVDENSGKVVTQVHRERPESDEFKGLYFSAKHYELFRNSPLYSPYW
ncbi:hypothetical protein PCANC_09723 [Puccinia coronata f. sp. avenae]|uniref:OTU domain-containing protein n=1 Tax=Puccinia coronata f. sp. avenae TaxID=200324 RepID=A0A2N5V7H9_9BASI|nr:hypothetical protein PCANC_09723 [Puccinia coronata f. sp. avenae]